MRLLRLKSGIVGCFLLALMLGGVVGQVKDQRVFDPVPAPLGARLRERLNLLIERQRLQQWDEAYDLLSQSYTQGKNKADFAKDQRHYLANGRIDKLVSFTPKSIQLSTALEEHTEWTIYGCADLREKEHIVKRYASVTAWREQNDWFFSDVGVITPIDGPSQPCPYSDANQHVIKKSINRN